MAENDAETNPEAYVWLERMAAKGWTVPTWPKEYGGAGLNKDEFVVLLEELQSIKARPPLGHGRVYDWANAPEYGTEEQKLQHLPPIGRGGVVSGLQRTRCGFRFGRAAKLCRRPGRPLHIERRKDWTSGANYAD